jgi:HSP20 family protein
MRKDFEKRPSGTMNRWFDDFLSPFEMRSGFMTPQMDVDETDSAFIISADMPGVSKSDIDIDCAGNQISISAVRHWNTKGEESEEQGQQTYQRTFTLPQGTETDKIEASYADGVLKITVPKNEKFKSRKIEIGEGKSNKKIISET